MERCCKHWKCVALPVFLECVLLIYDTSLARGDTTLVCEGRYHKASVMTLVCEGRYHKASVMTLVCEGRYHKASVMTLVCEGRYHKASVTTCVCVNGVTAKPL